MRLAESITTKNITSVDEISSVDNTDKVFVNDNGSFKQISVSNLMKQAPSGVTEETDPTVSEWAKQPTKPSYTADEVGALPVGTKIPTKTSDLANDSGYLTQIPEEYVTETELGQKGYVIEDDIPEKLPSPGTLTFTGAVNDTYDGSVNKTINIPTGGGEGGTSDYNALANKPKLNGVEIAGNKTSTDYKIVSSEQGIENNGKFLGVGVDGNVTPVDAPSVDPEQIKQAVNGYLEENPVSGMTTEQEQQLNQNTSDVSNLKSALEEIDDNKWAKKIYNNIFDKETAQYGYYFYDNSSDKTTGGGTASYYMSEYIEVDPATMYMLRNIRVVKCYDAEKMFISTIQGSSSNVIYIIIPENVYYIKFDTAATNIDKSQITNVPSIFYEIPYDTYNNTYRVKVNNSEYTKGIIQSMEEIGNELNYSDMFKDGKIQYSKLYNTKEWHWNVVDPKKIYYGYRLSSFDGTVSYTGIDETGVRLVYWVTDFIEVLPGERYTSYNQTVCAYNSEKSFLSTVPWSNESFSIPEDAKYIKIGNALYYNNLSTHNVNFLHDGYGKTFKYHDAYSYSHSFPQFCIDDNDGLVALKGYLGTIPLANKRFIVIGDSFTAPNVWFKKMCNNLLAVPVANHAISGGAFASREGVPKTAYQQAQEIVTNKEQADYVLVTLGTNDANNSVSIGEIIQSNNIEDFDLSTFSGGMQACLNYLMENNPNAKIKVGWTPAGGNFGVRGNTQEYISRMQEICLFYGVEYIETRTCGMTQYVNAYEEFYENGTSGGHPTSIGQDRIAEAMTLKMLHNY